MPVFGLPQHQGTPIWPWTRKLIGDLDRDLQMKVSSWRFLHAGKPVHFAMPDGREISYSGVRFSGSVKTVFWSAFIEPFLLEGAIEVLGKVGIKAEACHVDAKESVTEAAMLLSVVVVRTYR